MMTSTQRRLIFGCFFLSGAAGLVYQVAWGKALGLVFGHTVYAIATVLAVFMGGLAWGSVWLGRQSERCANPIVLYGWIELGIGLTGALSLAGLAGVQTIYLAIWPALAGSSLARLVVRVVGTGVILLAPTFLMGGTLPILVRGLTRNSQELAARLSRLYWVNTLGAVAGTLAAGFLLLPALGLRATVACAAAINLLVGATALWIARSRLVALPEPLSQTGILTGRESGARSFLSDRPLLSAFALVGATSMAYEIGWTRLLATLLGSSTYAFTLMLGTFLAGIVLGSALFEAWSRRGHAVRPSMFARGQTLTGLAGLAFLLFFQQLPNVVPPILRATHETFGGLILAQFVTIVLAMLPAAIVFGFNFPVVTLLIAGCADASAPSSAVGRAYAANTLGAIAGAVATGFWLVPRLGSFRTVAVAAGCNLLLATLLELQRTPRRFGVAALDLSLVLAGVAMIRSGTFYNRALATFGTVLYWNLYEGHLTLAETAATTDILFAEDGLNASISVARAEDYLALRTNGKVDASNRDAKTQLLVGHLGAIFHPAPRRALVIGFGSGMTVSALARYPELERIDCVEIEPAVLRAAAYLESLNRGVLRDPRVRVILDDARSFLLTARDRYDLIISEPSNPWIAGVATLFTEEYYRAARQHLNPDGIFIQWVQAYSLYPEDLRMVLATFVPQFVQVTLWRGEEPDLLLLARGSRAPLRLDRLGALWAIDELRADYQSVGLRHPDGLLAYYLLDDVELRQFASGSTGNTDDHTYLEYRAPRALLARRLEDQNLEMIRNYRKNLLPRDLLIDDPRAALEDAAETLLNADEKEAAESYLDALEDSPGSATLEILRGRLALARNHLADAQTSFRNALHLDPASTDAALGLADTARRLGDLSTAELLLRQTLSRDTNSVRALEIMVELARSRRMWPEAVEWHQQRIAVETKPPRDAYATLGELLLRRGAPREAAHALATALEHEPYSYAAHHNLAELYRSEKRWVEARSHLEFLVRYFPDTDAEIYIALAEVDRDAGNAPAAAQVLRKGLRIFPNDPRLRRALSPAP